MTKKITDPNTILVVEDDDDIRESLCEILESEGYSVIQAKEGKEALARLEASNQLPGLILLDLMMPVMDGWQFLNAQEGNSSISEIPVYVLSAVVNQAKALRVAGYVKKPVELDDLLGIVQRHCRAS